ncbi:MAG: DUF3299 domain-containing protein [Limnobacter sp.]|nr:DUF3299 domain-containing protein [Limnobacter sp.]
MSSKPTWQTFVIGLSLTAAGYYTTEWMMSWGQSKNDANQGASAEGNVVGSADGQALKDTLKQVEEEHSGSNVVAGLFGVAGKDTVELARAEAGKSDSNYELGEKLPGDSAGKSKGKGNFDPAYPELDWDSLIPAGWDPMASFKGLNLAKMKDSDPKAMEALDKMKKAWSEAPVESGLNGRKVRIAGFAVPLEQSDKAVSELLLVPYFGACIHTPPPPANQIIHVKLKNKVPALGAMQPYWVWGELKVTRTASSMGDAGYRIEAVSMTPYEN